MNTYFVSGGIITKLFQLLFQFIAQGAGQICQGLAGVMFKAMNFFISTGADGLVSVILKPVLDFSLNFLVPLAKGIIVLLVIWNLIKCMWGRFSNSQDNPIELIIRFIIFYGLILSTSFFINFIGGNLVEPLLSATVEWTNTVEYESAGSSLRNDLQSSWNLISDLTGKEVNSSDYTTLNDDLNDTGDSFESNQIQSTEAETTGNDNEKKKEKDDDTNTTISSSDASLSDTASKYNTKDLASDALAGALLSTQAGFFLVLLGIIIYVLIYGVLVLLIAYNAVGVCWKLIQRLVAFYVVLYCVPLAFATAPSKSTSKIFESWCRMIAGYTIALILNIGFMKCAQEVITRGFILSGMVGNIIGKAFCFGVILAFITMIKELEKYIDKLGLNVVGWTNRSLWESLVGGFALKAGTNLVKGAAERTKSNLQLKAASISLASTDSASKPITDIPTNIEDGKNLNEKLQDGNKKNIVPEEDGMYAYGKDGMLHEINPDAEADENGMVEAMDGTKIDAGAERFGDITDANIQLEGADDVSPYAALESANINTVPDENGEYYMNPDTGALVNGADIEESDLYDSDGNVVGKDYAGNKFAKVGDSLVNIGDGQKHAMVGSIQNGSEFAKTKDGKNVNVSGWTDSSGKLTEYGKRQMKNSGLDFNGYNEKDGTLKTFNAQNSKYLVNKDGNGNAGYVHMNGNYYSSKDLRRYDEKVPGGGKYLNQSGIRYTSYNQNIQADGTQTGVREQTLSNGKKVYVPYKRVPYNELHKDEIEQRSSKGNDNSAEGWVNINGERFYEYVNGDPIEEGIIN